MGEESVILISLLPTLYSINVKNCLAFFVDVKIALHLYDVRILVLFFDLWGLLWEKKGKIMLTEFLCLSYQKFSVRKLAMQICRDRKKTAIVRGSRFFLFSLNFSVVSRA